MFNETPQGSRTQGRAIVGRIGNDPFCEFTAAEWEAVATLTDYVIVVDEGSSQILVGAENAGGVELGLGEAGQLYANAIGGLTRTGVADGDEADEVASLMVQVLGEAMSEPIYGGFDDWKFDQIGQVEAVTFSADEIGRAARILTAWQEHCLAEEMGAADDELRYEDASTAAGIPAVECAAAWTKFEVLMTTAHLVGEGISFTR